MELLSRQEPSITKMPMTLITKEFCAQLIFVLFKRNQKLWVLTGLEIRLTLEVDGNVSPRHLAESRALFALFFCQVAHQRSVKALLKAF